MKKDNLDPSELHDPLDQNLEENTAEAMIAEAIADADEVAPAEESAMNIDNETALEADAAMAPKEAEEVEEAPKKKGRESTSEKAKKAAAARVAKGQSAAPVSSKALDPLRLRGKKYKAVASKVDKNTSYPLEEAIELVKILSTSSFVGALEAHIKIKGEGVRGVVTLPSGTGKTKKVAVADDATLEKLAAGKIDFDVLLATPAQMPKLAKFAKVLGPKGLMPSPKAGTVTEDIEKVTAEISGGRVEYRADKTGVIHLSIGRLSFTTEQLAENYQALMQALASTKVLTVSLAPTMGPGIKVQL